ncbi:MAG: molybdate ABC transporter substrate-binding protein [Spirochaetales bacterium]|nr:molybdate ABC transporter substrate-binding protein [Spirochaetales bacterium]
MNKKNHMIILLLSVIILAELPASGSDEHIQPAIKNDIIVFNAASTADLINDLGVFFCEQTGISIKSSPASSGTLARQLEQGAGADIYISASAKWIDYVRELGLSAKDSQFAHNELVIVAPVSSDRKTIVFDNDPALPDLFKGRISIGDPAHVPAGQYAVEVFAYYGWMESLKDRIQPAADVRAALAVVEMEETELGIVYKTDAVKSDKVRIIGIFPEKSHTPVVYYCALLKNAPAQAEAFYTFLLGNEAGSIFGKYGFTGNIPVKEKQHR